MAYTITPAHLGPLKTITRLDLSLAPTFEVTAIVTQAQRLIVAQCASPTCQFLQTFSPGTNIQYRMTITATAAAPFAPSQLRRIFTGQTSGKSVDLTAVPCCSEDEPGGTNRRELIVSGITHGADSEALCITQYTIPTGIALVVFQTENGTVSDPGFINGETLIASGTPAT